MDHFHRFCQNLHGPQVRTCIGKLCAFTCSSNVPKLPGSNDSATTASLDDEALEDPSRGGAGGGDPSRGGAAGGDGGAAGGDWSRGVAAGGDSSRSGVPDATDEGVGEGAGEDAATDSTTDEAADSATEDSVAASEAGVAGDAEGAGDEGAGVEDCADESDILCR